MIEDIGATIGNVRGSASTTLGAGTGRRVLVVGLVVLLVGLSGYLGAGSTTIALSIGDDAAATGASVPTGGGPEGFVSGPIDARTNDSDGDGITNGAERRLYHTDPTERDTDRDGIGDGRELACPAAYPDADPRRQDVYVELDSVAGVDLDAAAVDRLGAAFAEAPVANPDGRTGIALHVVRSEDALPEGASVNDDGRDGPYNDLPDYREGHFERRDAGYYYLLVSTNVAYGGDDYYAGAGTPGAAVVEHYDRSEVMSSLVLHELGHAFGIDRGTEGVDTRSYTGEEYHSVMNYNVLYETMTYSDGDDAVGRDEWAYVANDRHVPAVTSPGGFCPSVPRGDTRSGSETGELGR